MNSYEKVTAAITEALDRGVVPWKQPWAGGFGLPTSMSTGRAYRGVNVFLLSLRGYASTWWGTYNAIKKAGGQVRKGESGTVIVFWKFIDEKDDDGNLTGDRFPILRTFNVFNLEQADWADGVPERFETITPQVGVHTPPEAIGAMIAAYVDAPSVIRAGDRAFYRPSLDTVTVPRSEQFYSAAGEFGTMAHELIHSTGHESRLDRGLKNGFASEPYAREELVAEMGAAFLAAEYGVGDDTQVEQSAAYIAGWKRAIANDPRMIVKAAGDAARAVARIIEYEADDAEEDVADAA